MNILNKIFSFLCIFILSINAYTQSSDEEKNFTAELAQFRQFANSQYQFPLHIVEYWSNDSKNMEASALLREFQVIRVYGGVYRSLSLNGFRLALCHELGHKVGGEPFIQVNSSGIESTVNRVQLSTEGQADYFAPSCLKKYMSYLKQTPSETSNQFTAFCGSDQTCAFLIAASWDLAQLLSNLQIPPADLRLWPYQDQFETAKTLNGLRIYPEVQCRFQTLVAGSLGQDRPSCWYRPNH